MGLRVVHYLVIMHRMDLKTYLRSLPGDQRGTFANACGTTPGHLRNIIYEDGKSCSPILATAIERESSGAVMRWDMRPTDWRDIWPELTSRPDAPKQQEAA